MNTTCTPNQNFNATFPANFWNSNPYFANQFFPGFAPTNFFPGYTNPFNTNFSQPFNQNFNQPFPTFNQPFNGFPFTQNTFPFNSNTTPWNSFNTQNPMATAMFSWFQNTMNSTPWNSTGTNSFNTPFNPALSWTPGFQGGSPFPSFNATTPWNTFGFNTPASFFNQPYAANYTNPAFNFTPAFAYSPACNTPWNGWNTPTSTGGPGYANGTNGSMNFKRDAA